MEGLKTTRVYNIFSTQSLVRPVLKEGSAIIFLFFLLPDAILFLSSFEPEYDRLARLKDMHSVVLIPQLWWQTVFFGVHV